jgi:hypothetical protein
MDANQKIIDASLAYTSSKQALHEAEVELRVCDDAVIRAQEALERKRVDFEQALSEIGEV